MTKKSKTTVEILGEKIEIDQAARKFNCSYCGKRFLRESSLAVHVCEKKKRWDSRGDPGSRVGLTAYSRFYELTQQNARKRTFEDFVESSYYRAFVKFGWWASTGNLISVERYTDWLIKENKKLDEWATEAVYSEFVRVWIRREPAIDALERSVNTAIKWSAETGAPFNDILRHGSANKICFLISTGWLSPWVLYGCESGQDFLGKINEEQLKLIWAVLDSDFWSKKFTDSPKDFAYVQDILREAGW